VFATQSEGRPNGVFETRQTTLAATLRAFSCGRFAGAVESHLPQTDDSRIGNVFVSGGLFPSEVFHFSRGFGVAACIRARIALGGSHP
jgi:hypothetical protein